MYYGTYNRVYNLFCLDVNHCKKLIDQKQTDRQQYALYQAFQGMWLQKSIRKINESIEQRVGASRVQIELPVVVSTLTETYLTMNYDEHI